MNKGIIELNDASIKLGVNGSLVAESSGYAVMDKQQLMLGTEALRNVKRLPRWTNNRFWHQLNTDGLSNATGSVRHHADLAFAHLEQMKQHLACDELVIAVPGHYDRTQLGLLLGMCKEAGLPVRALVDLGLLAAASQPSHNTAVYLDVGLHSITLTSLRSDGVLRQTGHQTVVETGLATYWDRWASLIAEQFIQSSRFDPMHEAASEQRLFDALPDFVRSIGDSRALTFELNLGNVTHSTALSKDQLLSATASAYPQIVQAVRAITTPGEDFTLLVSPRLRHFPELMTSLQLIPDADIVHVAETAAIENSEMLWQALVNSSDSVAHITTIATGHSKPQARPSQAQGSHLLVGHDAYALKNLRSVSGFDGGIQQHPDAVIAVFSREKDGYGVRGVDADFRINGASASEVHLLSPGDELSFQGHSARVIAER